MSNYEPFFGFRTPLFTGNGEQPYLFQSDQLESAAEAFRTAFERPNPLICMDGQLGCGKSATVRYALDQLGEATYRVSIGRVRLAPDDVIDLVLDKLDVEDTSGGTIRKLGRFAKRVSELRDEGQRVVFVVEDAARTRPEILVELDVLCSGDAGADVALVVCGDEGLKKLLKSTELEPLQQRMETYLNVLPLAVDEMEDYLRQAVTESGGNYDQVFGKDIAGLTHILSCGVPRIANKLIVATLAAAAKRGDKRVSCALLADVAKQQFDIETELPVHRKAPAAADKPPQAPAASSPAPAAPPKTAPPVADATPAAPAQPPTAPTKPAPTTATPKPDVPELKPDPVAPPAASKPPPAPVAAPAEKARIPDATAGKAAPQVPVAKAPVAEAPAAEYPELQPSVKQAPVAPTPDRQPTPKETPKTATTTQADTPAAPNLTRGIPDVSALTNSRLEDKAPEPQTQEADIPHLIQDTQPELKALEEETPAEPASDGGNYDDLPNLEDLTAEFAAVSQMLEALPINPEPQPDDVEIGFDAALADIDVTSADLSEQPDSVEETTIVNETSTSLPRLNIPNEIDPTATQGSLPTDVVDAAIQAFDSPESPPVVDVSVDIPTLADTDPEPGLEPEDNGELVVTRTDLSVADSDESEIETFVPEIELEASADPIESAADALQSAADATDSNDADRDPTLAQLKPDLDALELALTEDVDLSEVELVSVESAPPEPEDTPPAPMPEITLDTSIEEKVAQASIEPTPEAGENSDGGPSDTEVHRMMQDLSKANSIEDMDDKLAETLFGDEINLVASQVLRAARESMDKEAEEVPAELSLEQTSQNPIQTPPAAQNIPPEEEGEVIDLKGMKPGGGLDMSASQRLRTVRALNAGIGNKPPPQAPPAKAAPQNPAADAPKPDSIEDQIDTSMTATFAALKIDPSVLEQDTDEEPEKKGFFSRFRKKG